MIRNAKRKHFSEAVTDHRDTKTIWQHIRSVKNNGTESSNRIPGEIIIDNENVTNSHEIACKLNEYFTSISKRLNTCNTIHQLLMIMWDFLRHTGISGLAKFLYGYIGNWYVFLNISTIIADINTVQTTLCSKISPVYFDLVFKIFFAEKDVAFCETTDTAHSYIKQIVKFSEIKVSIDA